MNKVFLIGRLTRDPDLRRTPSNIATTTFSIAVNRNFTNQAGERDADFINIVVWRKQAENCALFLKKGSQVAIEGRIQTRNYDGQDGKKVYVTEVIADNVEFIGSRNSSENSNTMSGSANYNAEPSPYDFGAAPEPKGTDIESNPYADFSEMTGISDDEALPF